MHRCYQPQRRLDGARKILGNQAIGGKNTKIHALVTENFQLVGLLLTDGNIHDAQCAIELLSKVNLEGKKVLADKAFSSSQSRFFLRIKNHRHIATCFDKLLI